MPQRAGPYARRDWNAAIPALAEVTAQTPQNGLYRFMLARARFEAKDYADALADYQRALDLKGADPAVVAFQIAKCHALLGNKDEAFRWLKIAIDGGYRYLEDARRDDAFAALRTEREGLTGPSAFGVDSWQPAAGDGQFVALRV